MIIVDPRSGEKVRLFYTPELEAELAAINAETCEHPEAELRRFPTRTGGEQVVSQCLKCGSRLSNPVKHPDRSSLPIADTSLNETYRALRTAKRNEIIIRHIELEVARKASHQKGYDAYMDSDEWKRKRKLVMKRCGGLCEGCGSAEAIEVHHLTYDHFENELLFELVGVCAACHARIHNS